MFLLVGLGNPGPKYASHRHNVGFMWVDALASAWGAEPFRAKFRGAAARASFGGEEVVLLKPETFMNLSGESVQAAMAFHKVPPDHVLVAHDELDLPFGTLRLKQGGGSAGHNGLKSIMQHVGADFMRLRVGIGRPPGPAGDGVSGYVLSAFSKVEAEALGDVLGAARAATEDLLALGFPRATERLHGAAAGKKPQGS